MRDDPPLIVPVPAILRADPIHVPPLRCVQHSIRFAAVPADAGRRLLWFRSRTDICTAPGGHDSWFAFHLKSGVLCRLAVTVGVWVSFDRACLSGGTVRGSFYFILGEHNAGRHVDGSRYVLRRRATLNTRVDHCGWP